MSPKRSGDNSTMDRKLGFIASPLHFITIANSLVILACVIKPSPTLLPQRFWYVQSNDIWVVLLGIAGTYFGLFLSYMLSKKKTSTAGASVDGLLSEKVLRNGRLLYALAILGYLLWIVTDFNGWRGRGNSAHLDTIPGVTTLTQLMPLSLACLTFSYRLGIKNRKDLILILIGITISVYRTQVNRERLTLIEVLSSIGVVILLTSKRKVKISFRKIYLTGLVGVYLLFSVGEYFRSWVFYKDRINESFFQFTFDRLLSYYSTAINNGAVYLVHHSEITSIPLYTLHWLWNFPFFGNFFELLFNKNDTYLSLKGMLFASMNTDEFNNISPYLQIPAEVTYLGSFMVFTFILFMISRLYREIQSNTSWQIPLYSVLVVGLLEFPRVFWFGNGRSFPMILMAIVMHRQLVKLQRIE